VYRLEEEPAAGVWGEPREVCATCAGSRFRGCGPGLGYGGGADGAEPICLLLGAPQTGPELCKSPGRGGERRGISLQGQVLFGAGSGGGAERGKVV